MDNNLFREDVKCGVSYQTQRMIILAQDLNFSDHEKLVLRRLAEEVARLAIQDEMREKISRWTAHNSLKSSIPVIYADPENGWNTILNDNILECVNPLARAWEFYLRRRIYSGNVVRDDTVITQYFNVPLAYKESDWGFSVHKTGGEGGGAFHFEAAIKDYEEDFVKLHFPQILIDWGLSNRILSFAHEIFDGILTVRRHQKWQWDDSYLDHFVLLRGLEEFMCDFLLEQEYLGRSLDFITDGMLARFNWIEEEGLLFSNNDESYVGTGGIGYCSDLPAVGTAGCVSTRDTWGNLQAQEMVNCSPESFGEFILPRFKRLAARFGHVCYGCCEPYDPKWQYIKQLPNLRKVSVSPWAKYETVPENLSKNYIASVKLIPTPLADPNMDEVVVRHDCREAVEKTYGGICQFLMKDNHALGRPENIVRWTQIMREEIARKY